jgi:DHA3 family tetracycline resistance protein-like MFS transporter
MFGATFFLGAFSETFDRLWEAHLLADFAFPVSPGWSILVWFGVIDAGALLLSVGATALARRWIGTTSVGRVPAVLIGVVSLLTGAVIGLGLAGEFYLAVGFYQAAVLLRIVHAPLLKAWLNTLVESRFKSTVFSMQGQSDAVGQLAGGPALGWLATALSLRVAFVVAGAILVPAIVLYSWAASRDQKDRLLPRSVG